MLQLIGWYRAAATFTAGAAALWQSSPVVAACGCSLAGATHRPALQLQQRRSWRYAPVPSQRQQVTPCQEGASTHLVFDAGNSSANIGTTAPAANHREHASQAVAKAGCVGGVHAAACRHTRWRKGVWGIKHDSTAQDALANASRGMQPSTCPACYCSHLGCQQACSGGSVPPPSPQTGPPCSCTWSRRAMQWERQRQLSRAATSSARGFQGIPQQRSCSGPASPHS